MHIFFYKIMYFWYRTIFLCPLNNVHDPAVACNIRTALTYVQKGLRATHTYNFQ